MVIAAVALKNHQRFLKIYIIPPIQNSQQIKPKKTNNKKKNLRHHILFYRDQRQ